jgi:hypothetical protein
MMAAPDLSILVTVETGATPPWHPIPADLDPDNDPSADYNAWERWFGQQASFHDLGGSEILDVLHNFDYRARIALYEICWRMLKHSPADTPHIVSGG